MARNVNGRVSNLLGSPASGEHPQNLEKVAQAKVSNLLGSPASGESRQTHGWFTLSFCFQFIGFPSEWGD